MSDGWTAASSPAWAQAASRRYDAAIPDTAPASAHAASSGPGGTDSAIRPATTVSGTTGHWPVSTASRYSANSASTGSGSTEGAASSVSGSASGTAGLVAESAGLVAGVV